MDKREISYNYWRLLDRFEDSLKGKYSLPHHDVPLFNFVGLKSTVDTDLSNSVENISFDNDTTNQDNLSLDDSIAACKQCGLSFKRIAPIPGRGSTHPTVLVVLDPPDLVCDETGNPLSPEVEEFILKWFESISLKPEDLYFTNVVKCRPPGLREPFVDETAICKRWLIRQIEEYQPRSLFVCGEMAARLLTGKKTSIDYFRNEVDQIFGLSTQITYSPQIVMVNSGLKRPVWEDLKKFRSTLDKLPSVGNVGT